MENLISNPESAPDWERLRPVLDEAMAELSDAEHDALLLRFFKKQDFHQVGAAFGITDDAAQKRVSRALDRLRESLSRRGITTATEALAIVIAANAIQAAPAGLGLSIATAALAASIFPSATAITTTAKAIAMTTFQKTIIVAALAAAVGTGIFEAGRASRLRNENQKLIAQNGELAQERDTALSNAAADVSQLEEFKRNQNELLRLRGEIGALRRQTNELEKLQRVNRELQASLARSTQSTAQTDIDPDLEARRQVGIAKMNDAKLLVLGWLMYATEHQDLLPNDLNQTSNYWTRAETPLTGTNQFELVAQGSLKDITNPMTTIVVREKEPLFIAGKWVKAYGFADGHSEVRVEPPEGFDAWEKQHISSRAVNQ